MSEEQNLFNQGEEEKNAVTTSGKNKKAQESIRMFLFGLCGLIGVVIIISASVGIYRVYAKVATDPFTLTVAKALRLPAMKVNGERILYSDYVEYLQAVKKSAQNDAQNGQPALTDEQVSDRVLYWLSDGIMIANAAKTFGVTVEANDLDDAKKQILQNFKDTATADAEIGKRYGWDLETYAKKILNTMVLQNKLNEKVSLDQQAKEDVRNKAEKILGEIKAGGNFEELAKQNGEDGTAVNGGTLGWFAKGDMVPEFESTAFALKKGEVSPELVETEFGYHIIKVDDKKTEKVKDSTGKMVNTEQVNARHILFRFPSLDTYLSKMSKQSKILLYIKVHNPFTDTATQQTAQQ